MSYPKPSIVIASVDQYIGQELARNLRHHYAFLYSEIRALHHHQDSRDAQSAFRDLRDLGIDMRPVDYQSESSLRPALANTDHIMLFPPMITQDPSTWVKETEMIITAAKSAQIKNLIMISIQGCEQAGGQRKQLAAFERVERKVKEVFGTQQTILRINFGLQHLRFWRSEIQEQGTFRFPIGRAQFTPVDLEDVARVVVKLTGEKKEVPAQYRQQVYTLTGPIPLDGEKLAQMLNKLGQNESRLRFEDTPRSNAETMVERDTRKMMSADAQRFNPLPGVQKHYAELLMDVLEMVKEGQLTGVTADYKRVVEVELTQPERALMEYAVEFRMRQ